MSNYTHIISLKPLGPFFFGGENTFGDDNANYFVKSNCLPQQTGLLGFLRYELLAQNSLLGTNPKGWANLIGEKSFMKDNGKFTETFGAIKKLSSVFLSDGSTHFIPQAMDWALYDKDDNLAPLEIEMKPDVKELTDTTLEIEMKSDTAAFTNTYKKFIPVSSVNGEPYNPKYGLKTLWVSSDGKSLHQEDFDNEFEEKKKSKIYKNGFFVKHQQIGIHRKLDRKRSDTGNFYKQVFYTLTDNLAFTFYANIQFPDNEVFESRLVTMGGERSAFYMEVNKVTDGFEDRFNVTTFSTGHIRKLNALVLTSNAYVPEKILKGCEFAITDSVPFRNISTTPEPDGNYARMKGSSNDKVPLKKSEELIYLLKRGSVFYHREKLKLEELQKKFKNTAFETIGYNQTLLLPHKK